MSVIAQQKTKPSGIPWLGDVPAHWEVKRLAYLGEFWKGRGIARADITDDGVPVILYGDIYTQYDHKAVSLVRCTMPEVAASSEEIRRGDLLLTGSGETKEDIGKCVVYLGDEKAFAGGDVIILRLEKADSEFLSYMLNSAFVASQKTQMAKGDIVVHIYSSDLRDIVLPLPPLPEQRAIATYLDERTARIDGLVARQRRLVQLLKEKRQALITRAVTRGLNPNANMKDSGVPWLGEVPVGWEVKPLKWFANCKSGDGISAIDIERETSESSSIPVIGGNGLSGYTFRTNTDRRVIVIGRVGALCGNVHLIDAPAWISDNALVLNADPHVFDQMYLMYVLLIRDLNQIAAKTAQPLITGTQVGEQILPSPPLPEQKRIATFIASETDRLHTLITKVEQAVERLQEYRTALISAAVTGKVRVPIR